jgi:hypothetical protein
MHGDQSAAAVLGRGSRNSITEPMTILTLYEGKYETY